MKNIVRFILPVVPAAVLLFSCNFEIPSSVSVKTSADYSFCLGDVDKDFTDNFDKSAMTTDLSVKDTNGNNLSDCKLYDYYPSGDDGKTQKFLLKLELYKQTFDTSQYADAAKFIPSGDKIQISSGLIPDMNTSVSADEMFKDTINKIGKSLGIVDGDGNGNLYSKVSLSEIPVYLYFDSSNLEDVSGKIYMYTSTESSPSPAADDYLINGSINLTTAPSISSDENVVTTNIDNITSTINKKLSIPSNSTLYVGYSNLGAAIKDVTKELSLSISAYMVIPFSFVVNEQLDIDVVKLAGNDGGTTDKEKDLLSRDKATDTSDIEKYLNAISSVSMSYETKNQPFYSTGEIKLKVDLDGEGTNYEETDMSIAKDTCEITNVRQLFETYPLRPSASLVIPAGTCSIPRTLGFTMNIKINFSTNGTVELF